MFLEAFRNPVLEQLEDGASLTTPAGRLAFTTDSYVVSPLFFPGGDIGDLAVNGTVNDLAMCGARPLHLSAGFILEEGFPVADLRRIVASMAAAAAGGRGADRHRRHQGGRARQGRRLLHHHRRGRAAGPADRPCPPRRPGPATWCMVSGPIGDHGITVMLARGELDIEADIVSDTAPLHGITADLLDAAGDGVRLLRDATRGGVATICNEVAVASGVAVVLEEKAIPVRPVVNGASELLGIDPLYVACEGRLVTVVAPDRADAALAALHAHPLGDGRRGDRHASPTTRRDWCCCAPGSAAPASSTCWSATRCRASADARAVDHPVDRGHDRGAARDRCRCTGCGWRSAKLSGVVPDAVRFAFELVTAGTTLDGAPSWRSTSRPGSARCRDCGAEFATAEVLPLCACGSADVQVLGGDELRIRDVAYGTEEEVEPCAQPADAPGPASG